MPVRPRSSSLLRCALRLGLVLLLVGPAGCKRAPDVGDHVMVEIWDEVVPRARIRGFVEGPVTMPDPPEKVRHTAVEAAKTNQHKIGDRVMVDWHGHYYPALIVGVVGPERYRIHYEGYGNEWDENVGAERIKAK